MTSQRRMHYSRACYFMLFCFEDGDKISLWNTSVNAQVHTVSQLRWTHRSFVLLFHFSLLLYTWDDIRKFVSSHVIKLYFICFYTLYMSIYIYVYISFEEWKGWGMPVVRQSAWVSDYLLNCSFHRFPCYFFVVVFLASLDVFGRLVLCLRVVFTMVYGEGGILA
jgi:hypothetical protein